MLPAVVGSLTELMALLAQSFNVAAIFPALVFMLAGYVFIFPFFQETQAYVLVMALDPAMRTLALATSVIFLAYMVNALNYVLIRLLEGYPLREQFPFDWLQVYNRRQLAKKDERCFVDLPDQIAGLETDIVGMENNNPQREKTRQRQTDLMIQQLTLAQQLLYYYPQDPLRVLPTDFGNVIAAAEEYPFRLFGMEAVLLWPLLTPTLTKNGYAKFVEQAKAVLDLLLNSLILVVIFGTLRFVCGFAFTGLSAPLGVELAFTGGIVACLLWLSTRAAFGWGYTIRTAFVLHRRELRQALGLKAPASYDEEVSMWKQVSSFISNPDRLSHEAKASLFRYPVVPTAPEATPARDKEAAAHA
jgi:hypothetical protein